MKYKIIAVKYFDDYKSKERVIKEYDTLKEVKTYLYDLAVFSDMTAINKLSLYMMSRLGVQRVITRNTKTGIIYVYVGIEGRIRTKIEHKMSNS